MDDDVPCFIIGALRRARNTQMMIEWGKRPSGISNPLIVVSLFRDSRIPKTALSVVSFNSGNTLLIIIEKYIIVFQVILSYIKFSFLVHITTEDWTYPY